MSRSPHIVALCPYSPWPADTGGKAEMLKHLEVLRSLGRVTIASARGKPVGGGWTEEALAAARKGGYEVVLREDSFRNGPRQLAGIAYAALAKSLGGETWFGHANPYHRHAFPAAWWERVASDADLCVFFYSFWTGLPSPGRKACVLLDLWSDVMRGGHREETRDLTGCDWVCVISTEEERRLRERGLTRLHRSPPFSEAWTAPDGPGIALVGSENRFNREGLRWLDAGASADAPRVRIYGRLARHATQSWAEPVGAYADPRQPYLDCGLVLFAAAHATGVQIKTIEALAAGRAIVARPEAVRGLPADAEPGWIVAATAAEAWQAVGRLRADPALRAAAAERARRYHAKHLDPARLRGDLESEYRRLLP